MGVYPTRQDLDDNVNSWVFIYHSLEITIIRCFLVKNCLHAYKCSQVLFLLKEAGVDYTIRWKILDKAQFYIICKQELATLNKRTELANTCRHANKFLLKNT